MRWAHLLLYSIGIGTLALTVARGVSSGVPGAGSLAMAVLPLLYAVVVDALRSSGDWTPAVHAMAATLLFATGVGAALVVRDAAVSEQYERLLRGSLDAIVSIDREGHVIEANPAAVRLLGNLSTKILRIADPRDHPMLAVHIERGQHGSDRTEFRTRRGRWMESLATTVGEDRVLLTIRDVTARRDLDRGLLKAARIETMGLLLGGIAHDFNNMLSTLLAHIGVLEMTLDDRPKELSRVRRMTETVERASLLTRRLLTVARGTGSHLGACDMRTVALAAIELVEPTFTAGITLVHDLPSDLPAAHGDASDLEQVLVNLLVNARDAVNGQGNVRLVARTFHLDNGARGVMLAVDDDGTGVAAEQQDQIFEPFVTTKPRGTGLGLAVAKQILRDHVGRIWFEGRPGGGSRFVVALRLATEIDHVPGPLPEGRRVLVVEDEDVLREEAETALRSAGFEVRAEATAEAAVPGSRPTPPTPW